METDNKESDWVVNSIANYLEWINQISNNGSLMKIWFRGQSDKDWDIEPSVLRNENHLDEYSLLQESKVKLWKELGSFQSSIEKLVYLQHCGLPTRLLDITSNPLVALFFACKELSDRDGAIYYSYRYEENSLVADITAEYLFNYNPKDNYHSEKFDSFFNKKKNSGIFPVYKSDFSKILFIKPPFVNSRIEAQSGAFFMFPLLSKEDSEVDVCDNYYFHKAKAIVPSGSKYRIIKDLCRLGIDEGSLMQDPISKIKSMVQQERFEKELFENILLDFK